MRAAIYARYSSDNQRDASIEDQVRQCRARLDREGWKMVGVYSDHGISGATTLRPGYQKLIEDARAGAFDLVLAEALDRLSRDQEDIAGLYKRLTFQGIKLVTLSEGEISELHVGLKGTMNALFLKDLAQKTWRGLEGRVRQGSSGGGLCYGYDVVKKIDDRGERIRGERLINSGEAAIIRRIFSAFAGGSSPRAIAKKLNAEGIPGPGGRAWSDTTIRGHHTRRTGLLRNALYVGRLIWNRQRYVKDPATGRRLARPNPESAWIIQEVPELRIIEAGLWESVQAQLANIRGSESVVRARSTRFWEKRRSRHMLTGLATCGVCGSPLASVGKDYLACSAARRQGTCTNRRSMRRSALEGLILDALKSQLMQPDAVKEFVAAFHEEANRLMATQEQELGGKQTEFAKVQRQVESLVDAIANGLRSSDLQSRLDALAARKETLRAELASAPRPAPRFHPNLAELYRQKVEQLHGSLSDPAIRQEAIEILRGLVEAVILRPVDGGVEIELVGDIVKMIELPEGKSGSSVPAPYRSSVKVVAGIRNPRQLKCPSRGLSSGRAPHYPLCPRPPTGCAQHLRHLLQKFTADHTVALDKRAELPRGCAVADKIAERP